MGLAIRLLVLLFVALLVAGIRRHPELRPFHNFVSAYLVDPLVVSGFVGLAVAAVLLGVKNASPAAMVSALGILGVAATRSIPALAHWKYVDKTHTRSAGVAFIGMAASAFAFAQHTHSLLVAGAMLVATLVAYFLGVWVGYPKKALVEWSATILIAIATFGMAG